MASLEAAASLTVIAGKTHLYWRIAQLAHGYWRDYPRVIAMVSRRTWLARSESVMRSLPCRVSKRIGWFLSSSAGETRSAA